MEYTTKNNITSEQEWTAQLRVNCFVNWWLQEFFIHLWYEYHEIKESFMWAQSVIIGMWYEVFEEWDFPWNWYSKCNEMITKIWVEISREEMQEWEVLYNSWVKGYQIVEYDKELDSRNDNPILVLADWYWWRYHIINDDHCYVLVNAKTWDWATHIFKEAHRAIKNLPDPV